MTVNTAPVDARGSGRSGRRTSSENVASKPLKATSDTKATTIMPQRPTRRQPAAGSKAARGRARGPVGGRARMGLGQAAQRDERVDRGDGGGDEERDVRAAERGDGADGRPEDEPDAEGGAEQPEQAGPVLGRRHVGDRRLGHRHAGPRGAVDEPAERTAATATRPAR